MLRLLSLAATTIGALAGVVPLANARTSVDVALVLTVDCSYSVDDLEFELQASGLAQAFRDPSVLTAVAGGPNHAIAVSIVQWSSSASQILVLPWTVITDGASAQPVSAKLAMMPRLTQEGGTSIASAIDAGVALLGTAPVVAARRVIDISSDGRNNSGRDVRAARDDAVSRGIVVNGLAILNEVPTLDLYFEQYVIGGAGAFVMVARSYENYVTAIRRKLIREITGEKLSDAAETAAERATRRRPVRRFESGGKG